MRSSQGSLAFPFKQRQKLEYTIAAASAATPFHKLYVSTMFLNSYTYFKHSSGELSSKTITDSLHTLLFMVYFNSTVGGSFLVHISYLIGGLPVIVLAFFWFSLIRILMIPWFSAGYANLRFFCCNCYYYCYNFLDSWF
jgi:hypothetical protein